MIWDTSKSCRAPVKLATCPNYMYPGREMPRTSILPCKTQCRCMVDIALTKIYLELRKCKEDTHLSCNVIRAFFYGYIEGERKSRRKTTRLNANTTGI